MGNSSVGVATGSGGDVTNEGQETPTSVIEERRPSKVDLSINLVDV